MKRKYRIFLHILVGFTAGLCFGFLGTIYFLLGIIYGGAIYESILKEKNVKIQT